MAKISFGTVEDMFAELKERNITEARLEPIVKFRTVGKDISVSGVPASNQSYRPN